MASFEEALLAGEEQSIELQFADGTVIDKKHIAASGGFRYEQIFNRNGDLQMGSAVMASVEVTLLNTNGIFYDFDFTQEFSVVYKAGGFGLVLGEFKGDRTDRVRSRKIVLAANDRMTLFDRDASEFLTSVQYPITLADFYISLCGYVGIGYYSGSGGVVPVNGDMIIDSDPFGSDSYTCRQILGWIAEAACAYAFITGVGQVRLKWFEVEYYYENFEYKEYTIKKSDRFELIRSEVPTPKIDRLEVYTSYSDRLNTAGTGSNVYVIADNPLLYAENDADVDRLQPYVNNIYAKLNAFPEYYPAAVRALSWPRIEGADIIRVTDDDGASLVFPVFAQTLTWSGRGKTEYENTGNPKRETVPVQQRELENLKKRMVSKADLKTEINSYLNSETGEAAISSVVSGKYVEAVSTVYSTPNDVRYGFEKDDEGYYTSTNVRLFGTFAYGRFTFKSASAKSVLFRCVNYGMAGEDFGIISRINTELAKSNTIDGEDKVFYSFQNTPTSEWVDVRIDVPAGESFVTIKYYKSGSLDTIGDCFKIKPVNEVVTAADLNAGIEMYINSQEGIGQIKTHLEGTFVESDELDNLISQSQAYANIDQKITATKEKLSSEISLTAGVGKGTIGSNVQAMLTLFSNTDSSSIKLNANAIDLSGYVTFSELSGSSGKTSINGANIQTGTITADKLNVGSLSTKEVILNSATRNTTVLRSVENSVNTNLTVYLGIENKYTSGDIDYAQFLRVYGSQILFLPPGAGESNTNALVVNTDPAHGRVFPAEPGDWSLGGKLNENGEIYYFAEVCANYFTFPDNSYLDIKNGRLRFTDKDGDHTYLT